MNDFKQSKIDYENGTIPIGELTIGDRVVDPSWEWEFRLGDNYSDVDRKGDPTTPGEVKPVTWIVVAKDHYDGLEPHVTLLSEDLIGLRTFDNSTGRDHKFDEHGYNHWGKSGTANASLGLRPWLNSSGIHAAEGFYHAFSDSFEGAVLTTTVPNKEWKNGSAYNALDYVFIPSATELGDSENKYTYPIGSVYPFFQGSSDAKRVAMMSGVNTFVKAFSNVQVMQREWWYWTRSPDSSTGFCVRIVLDTGEFTDSAASNGRTAVRPALNLKSEVFVSEIKD